MRASGYIRLNKLTYIKSVGDGINSFAEFNLFGSPLDKISCDFGVSSVKGIDFAYRCLKLYGGPLYQSVEWEKPPFNLRCQVGRVCAWGDRSAINFYKRDPVEVSELIVNDISLSIWPKFKSINDSASLSRFLLSDEDDIAWKYCNAAVRSIEYMHCVWKHKSLVEIIDTLSPFEVLIQGSIDRGVDYRDFLRRAHALLISTED